MHWKLFGAFGAPAVYCASDPREFCDVAAADDAYWHNAVRFVRGGSGGRV